MINFKNFYGVTNDGGTIFSLTSGDIFNSLYSFTGLLDFEFPNIGLILMDGIFYGTTGSTIFKFTLSIICFDESTQILSLINGKEIYVPISELTRKNYIKVYKYGYLKIQNIGYNTMINNHDNWQNCMYKLKKTSCNYLTDDLIVTGGHSVCVDSLTQTQLMLQSKWWINGISQIEDKYRLLSVFDDRFEKITERKKFKYYHLTIEGEKERYGIYANGILSESCTKKFK